MLSKPFESRIQDLVYNVDVGLGQRLIKLLLFGLLVAGVMIIYGATQYKGFRDASAMENAQLARNYMQTGELTTKSARPASIWLLKENGKPHSVNNHPDVLHPPLYPMVLSVWYKIWGLPFDGTYEGTFFWPEKVINILNQLFTVLTGLLVYLLGLRLFERRVAILGVSVYLFSVMVLEDSISGLPIPMLTLLVTAMLFFGLQAITAKDNEGRFVVWFVPYLLAVLLCIASFYTRYGAIVLVPALMLLFGVGFRNGGWLWSILVLVLFMLGVAPWIMRNLDVTGTYFGLAPYMALMDTSLFPGYSFSGSLAPEYEEFWSHVYKKWLANFSDFMRGGQNAFGSGLVICLFLSTYFYRFIRFRVHLLRWCLALSGLLLAFAAGFFGEVSYRLMHIFWPMIVLYAMAFYFLLLDRLQLKTKVVTALITAVVVILGTFPLVLVPLPPRADAPNPPYVARAVHWVSQKLQPDELMCTDMPWATAWYGNRMSVDLPVTLDDFYEIYDKDMRVSGLYLTMLSRNASFYDVLYEGPYKFWLPIQQLAIPPNFPLRKGMFPLPNNSREQLFLTDRSDR